MKTVEKRVVSERYGPFKAHETILYCGAHKHIQTGCGAHIEKVRSHELLGIVRPRHKFGYDVTVAIGKHMFLKHRTIEQTLKKLHRKGIEISKSEASYQAKRFLISLKCLHELNDEKILAKIEQQGGYILHIDSTSAEDSDHVFVALDGLSGFILFSSKIRSENMKEITAILEEMKARFGAPILIMKDMAKAVENACRAVFPAVCIVECHFHFCRDVGREMLEPYYNEFKSLMNDLKIQTELKRLLKDVRSTSKERGYQLKKTLEAIDQGKTMDSDPTALLFALMYDLLVKIVKGKRERSGIGFPFNLPIVDLYRNCVASAPLIRNLVITYAGTNKTNQLLHRLDSLLKRFMDHSPSKINRLFELNHAIESVYGLFQDLRTALRINGGGPSPLSDPLRSSVLEQQTIHADLLAFKQRLEGELSTVPCSLRRENQLIVDHLARHLDMLELPVIEIWNDNGVRLLDISRTNNLVEQHFRFVKRSRRKSHGRSDVGYDLNEYGPYLSYVENLLRPGYIELVYGSWDGLITSFSEIPYPTYIREENEYDEIMNGSIRPYRLEKGHSYLFVRGVDALGHLIDSTKYGITSGFKGKRCPTDV